MTKLGHQRFAVVGHDTGMVISYALAADFRDRVARLAVAEVPGPPTLKGSPPAFIDAAHNDKLWHISFNRVNDDLILDMVSSNADAYYRYEYEIQGGGTTPPEKAIKYYIGLYTSDRASLRASFGFYRAWDATTTQNATRQATPLTIPVLGIGGVNSWGPAVGGAMNGFATNVQTAVIAGAGHWVAEQAPRNLLATLRPVPGALPHRFLTPRTEQWAASSPPTARSGHSRDHPMPYDDDSPEGDDRAQHAFARRSDAVDQLAAPGPRSAARPRGAGQLLDADLHQLAAHRAPSPGLVTGLP